MLGIAGLPGWLTTTVLLLLGGLISLTNYFTGSQVSFLLWLALQPCACIDSVSIYSCFSMTDLALKDTLLCCRLGLGAKYLSHSKALETSTALDRRLGGRIRKSVHAAQNDGSIAAKASAAAPHHHHKHHQQDLKRKAEQVSQ